MSMRVQDKIAGDLIRFPVERTRGPKATAHQIAHAAKGVRTRKGYAAAAGIGAALGAINYGTSIHTAPYKDKKKLREAGPISRFALKHPFATGAALGAPSGAMFLHGLGIPGARGAALSIGGPAALGLAAGGADAYLSKREKSKQAAIREMRDALSTAVKNMGKPKGPVQVSSMGLKGQVGLGPGGVLPGFPKNAGISLSAFSDELAKLGEGYPDEPKRPKKAQHPVATIGKSMAGLAVGTAAGYGLAKAMESIARKKGFPIGSLIPALATGAGVVGAFTAPLLYAHERKKMEDYARQRS